jgi:glucose/arabinose dehydrogenase
MPGTRVTQALVTRLLKGAAAAGRQPTGVRVEPDGSILLTFDEEGSDHAQKPNPWDEVLEK